MGQKSRVSLSEVDLKQKIPVKYSLKKGFSGEINKEVNMVGLERAKVTHGSDLRINSRILTLQRKTEE